MNKKFLTVQDMAIIALFTAIIAVCSWIVIPFGTIPFTLQTFGVFITAGVLGLKRGIFSVLVYILLGMAGVPVFSGFKGGISSIIGPTGGYIIGFIFATIIIGIFPKLFGKKSGGLNILATTISMVLGDVACFAVGTIQFMYIMKVDLLETLTICVIPFIIPDIIKVMVAVIVVNRMKKYVRKFFA